MGVEQITKTDRNAWQAIHDHQKQLQKQTLQFKSLATLRRLSSTVKPHINNLIFGSI
jgi:hypothetical protein